MKLAPGNPEAFIEKLIESNVLYKQIYETLFQKQKSGTILKTELVKGGI